MKPVAVVDEHRDDTPKVARSKWVYRSAAAVLGLYAAFVLLLWSLGLLDFSRNGDPQAFAAVLALLGGMFASSLTFIGLLIKHSVDERSAKLAEQTERRLQIEADRNNQLAKEAEDRLKLDTSLRAVDLLSAPDGSEASAAEQTGALFALAHLGQIELALALLGQIWPARGVSFTEAAGALINAGLATDSPHLHWRAAEILEANYELLLGDDGDLWAPSCIEYRWPTHMDLQVRESLFGTVLKALSARDLPDWDSEVLSSVLVVFEIARREEPAAHLRAAFVLAIQSLLETRTFDPGQQLLLPDELLQTLQVDEFPVDEVRADIEKLLTQAGLDVSAAGERLVSALRKRWWLLDQDSNP